jgi:hypothetical protein
MATALLRGSWDEKRREIKALRRTTTPLAEAIVAEVAHWLITAYTVYFRRRQRHADRVERQFSRVCEEWRLSPSRKRFTIFRHNPRNISRGFQSEDMQAGVPAFL